MLYLGETCVFKKCHLVSHGNRPTYSLCPRFQTIGRRGGASLMFAFHYNIGDLRPSIGFQNSVHLGHEFRLCRREVDDTVGNHNIKYTVPKGQILRLDMKGFDSFNTEPGEIVSGTLDHLQGEIHAANPATGTCFVAGDNQIKTRPAADIENVVTFIDSAQGKGVADTAEGIEQIFRHTLQYFTIVTECFGTGLAGLVLE